jgi:hypothetical protein
VNPPKVLNVKRFYILNRKKVTICLIPIGDKGFLRAILYSTEIFVWVVYFMLEGLPTENALLLRGTSILYVLSEEHGALKAPGPPLQLAGALTT